MCNITAHLRNVGDAYRFLGIDREKINLNNHPAIVLHVNPRKTPPNNICRFRIVSQLYDKSKQIYFANQSDSTVGYKIISTNIIY